MDAIEVRQTEKFARWFKALRDVEAADRIAARIRRLSLGNAGDAKPIGDGIHEMRSDDGPKYRLYFVWRETTCVVLLCTCNRGSQARDIAVAKNIAKEI